MTSNLAALTTRRAGHTRIRRSFFVLSKADIVPSCPDLEGEYSDEDVRSALRSLGDQAVINAANRFPVVHWHLMAPMPAQGGGPQGVGEVLSLLLRQLR